ncbi:MAG: MFS transporter [Polyangiaceae bacterium]|nr:MFS transporter [Polyangiaceae bacterium]
MRTELLARIRDPNLWRIYRTTLALGLAYGLSISLLAVFLDLKGFNKSDIGSLAAWFASGIVAASIPAGYLIRRFSAKAMLVVSLTGYALTVTAFPFVTDIWSLSLLRFVDGAFSVGAWISLETLLLARADADSKAFVTSIYAVAMAVGYVVGPLGARALAAVLPLYWGFVCAGVIALGAAIYVVFAMGQDPLATHSSAAEPRGAGGKNPDGNALLWRIKTSCLGTFAYGYFQASVVLFLPLFLMGEKGIAREQTIIIPAFFAFGMLLFSNYAGRLGDRYGHLMLMRVLAIVGGSMTLGFVFLDSFALMCSAVFVAGASLASISPLSLALQGLQTAPGEYSRATALYNAFYALGMLGGPVISSRIFEHSGGASMLYHLALLWLTFIIFTMVFYRDDPRVQGQAALSSS